MTPPSPLRDAARKLANPDLLIWLLLAVGIVLRVKEYACGRSLWLDEAMLANNIADRSFLGLFHPLDNDQVAPIGLLLTFKAAFLLFGQTDYALRTVPLLSGIAVLFLGRAALRLLCPSPSWPAVFGMALFALNRQLNFFSVEFKQYETDAVASLLLFLLLALHGEGRLRFRWLVLAGALALLFSHPALFSLAAIGGTLLLAAWREKSVPLFRRALAAGAVWIAVEGLNYFFLLRNAKKNDFLQNFWASSFMPGLGAGLWANLAWIGHTACHLFDYTWIWQIGMPHPVTLVGLVLIGLFMLAGFPVLFRRDWRLGSFLVLLIVAALAGAGARLYPLSVRMLLFLIPFMCLLPALGLALAIRTFALRPAVVAILVVVPLIAPTTRAAKHYTHPRLFQEVKVTERLLQSRYRPGDLVLVDRSGEHAYRFYARQLGFHPVPPAVYTDWDPDQVYPPIVPYLREHRPAGRIWLIAGVICGLGGPGEAATLDVNPAKLFPKKAADLIEIDSHDEADETDLYLFHMKNPDGR
ncbi:hypothetical protein SAMN05444156_1101 [Verrucomicrobium sp. GAS474]|uniref:hypothetical protein n=1 Tax=Verrucomicrobium sp. GAS474 TaxID=1882831 RepID=UPI00087D714D|nr:hypothetical protein [Verrucomicrobium sp. GAS474]SDT96324.1 hypothetical protein SAMN05444156_1101 [Verrucomicrobium sp. GAS474]